MRGRPRRRLGTHLALLVVLVALAGCVSSTSSRSGGNTLDGGVKIPVESASSRSPSAATVRVTLTDTNGKAPMGLTVTPATVPAGDVTFVVKNAGSIVHEAVVLKTDVA